jgi:quercetin dioxygenase-like cupin family protein
MNKRIDFGAALILTFFAMGAAGDHATAAAPPNKEDATVAALMSRDVLGTSDKEAVMLTVAYGPGGSSLPHRHDAQVFVYVLEGSLTMQVDGSAPVTISAGQTFYESPDDVHRLSMNASQTEPAKILVFMIKKKGSPGTRAVKSAAKS